MYIKTFSCLIIGYFVVFYVYKSAKFFYNEFTSLEKIKKPFMWKVIHQRLSFVSKEAQVDSDLLFQNITLFPIEIKKVSTGILDTQNMEVILGISTFSPPIHVKPFQIANIRLNSYSNNNTTIIQECKKHKKVKLQLYYKLEYYIYGIELFKEYLHEVDLPCLDTPLLS